MASSREYMKMYGGFPMSGWMSAASFEMFLGAAERIRNTDRFVNIFEDVRIRPSIPELPRHVRSSDYGFTLVVMRREYENPMGHDLDTYASAHFHKAFKGGVYPNTEGLSCRVRSINLQVLSGDPALHVCLDTDTFSDPSNPYAGCSSGILWIGLVPEDKEKLNRELEERT